MEYTITLPEPPSVNRYFRFTKRGHAYKPKVAKDYQELVGWQCIVANITEPIQGDVKLTLRWYRSRRTGDLDNRMKVALDSLEGYAYENDKQVTEIHAYRYDDKDDPRLEVTIQSV